jgi:hypothetical protein
MEMIGTYINCVTDPTVLNYRQHDRLVVGGMKRDKRSVRARRQSVGNLSRWWAVGDL